MNKTETSPLPLVAKMTSKGKRVILSTVKMSLDHSNSMEKITAFFTKALCKLTKSWRCLALQFGACLSFCLPPQHQSAADSEIMQETQVEQDKNLEVYLNLMLLFKS